MIGRVLRAILRVFFEPQQRSHRPPEYTGPPPTKPPPKPVSSTVMERTLLEFLARPPRAPEWWRQAPACSTCAHTVMEHSMRSADRGCNVIGCNCAAFAVLDDR